MPIQHILTGGFLAGRRTYILAALAVLTELAHWAIGDQSLGALLNHLPNIFGELSIAALRAGVASSEPLVAVLEEAAAPIQHNTPTPPAETELVDAFKDALDLNPFLKLEIGYNRRTGWMVHVWNARGVEYSQAPKIICTQDEIADDAFAEATAKLRELGRGHTS